MTHKVTARRQMRRTVKGFAFGCAARNARVLRPRLRVFEQRVLAVYVVPDIEVIGVEATVAIHRRHERPESRKKPGSDGRVMTNDINDGVIVAARLCLSTLFLIFGWRKLRDFPGTITQMAQDGVPAPVLAAVGATFMELPVAFAIAVGALTRPSAILMALYTLGTSLVEHRYWTITGADYVASLEGFYKNLSIIGGFLLLYVTGGGIYSIDSLWSIAAR